ncbi:MULTISPECIES: tryptophan halogenase family protein [unclassified Pseudoalteromonas]|uniref:tryptophan halogenase family protein n=1 Tax=unclassified Pseudoalteromonas TaxID=194690 RepID=UPI00202ADD9C|nr:MULTISPECIES: tryptophan halogenase family protein [unclassified Pseudoalteromonas]MCP4587301.1 tryptophan 7-halogenase [Pseudoalteromonas sp.]URQ92710.1 tryptophan 7-halogenase [Pseudoalteromonas sp. SCSIO 43101]
MRQQQIKQVVIAGGGTAGWMTAAALAKLLNKDIKICLIESDDIGTVGVGEATIPPIRTFHKLLGIDEQEFMRATQATFKLGISFENWHQPNSDYIHSFGMTGKECWAGEFHHFWLHWQKMGNTDDFADYCYELQAAKQGKFGISPQNPINYAFHMDASRYATFLRAFSENLGVKRIEGKIERVNKHSDNGFIKSLSLDNNTEIAGDFFIDCTGFKGILIEQALHTGFEDWSHLLPCDSAVAVQTKGTSDPLPYTRSIAHQSGWQWQIPLQNRIGNGLVYCSRYLNDHDATKLLLDNLIGDTLTEPKIIKFKTGRRRKGWNKNCLALGLASGFLEPLESTSIHLIMTGIIRFMRLYPFAGVTQQAIDEYNKQLKSELESIRDFIVLHYKVTDRQDSEFWRHCQAMEIPESLAHKIALFKETGRVFLDDGDIFRVDSWVQVMLGQGVKPKQYHYVASLMNDQELGRFMQGIKQQIAHRLAQLPTHKEFINKYCRIND